MSLTVSSESNGHSPLSFVSLRGASGVGSCRMISVAGEADPSEAMLIRVVVVSAGRDLLGEPAFLVNWIERDLKCLGVSGSDVVDGASSDVIFPATEMLSRATSVTAAALDPRGQDFVYQACFQISISNDFHCYDPHRQPTYRPTPLLLWSRAVILCRLSRSGALAGHQADLRVSGRGVRLHLSGSHGADRQRNKDITHGVLDQTEPRVRMYGESMAEADVVCLGKRVLRCCHINRPSSALWLVPRGADVTDSCM